MKKALLVTLTMVSCTGLFAQIPTVAVASFGIQAGSGVTKEEASVAYELFIAELVSTGAVNVVDRVNLDRIVAEMRFQTTDWSNPQKTVALGQVLNANIIVQGRFLEMDGSIYWVVTMLDLNTAAIYSSSRVQLKDMGQVWNALPGFCKQLVERIKTPPPNAPGIPTIAVSTFDVQGGITPAEAEVVTELFLGSLVARNDVLVVDRVNFDKILEEMRFQTSDWSNKDKTARLGGVLNAGIIIRGQLMKMGGNIFWTATVLDVNTAQILSSSRQQMKNFSELWEKNILANASQQIMSQLPPPNFFVGRWQATKEVNRRNLFCILDIKADGTIVVERYDTIQENRNRTVDGANLAVGIAASIVTMGLLMPAMDLDNQYKFESTYNLNANGTGTGISNNISKVDTNRIKASISLNLKGITSGIPRSLGTEIFMDTTNPSKFTVNYRQLRYWYRVNKENGSAKSTGIYDSGDQGYTDFTRIN